MDDDFNPDEFRPAEFRRDTELTVGPMMLLGIFGGLMLLCGLCFGVGYSLGSRGVHETPTPGQPSAGAATQAAVSLPKPSAVQKNTSRPPAVADLPPAGVNGANSGADSRNTGRSSASGADSTQPLVKPALPAAATVPTPTPAQPAPALPASTTNPEQNAGTKDVLMVQIAIVSGQEDANILINALGKRGYTATASRDASDNKLHVRIGPFTSRSNANAMCRKLLHDGYNAILQP